MSGDRETRRRGGTGESGKLRWPTDRPRGETRRWTRWIQGGEGSRLHGSAAQVGPRIGRGRGRGETRRAHVWHTHRNPRADGRPSAEAVPWTTYLWWGRHVGSSSFLFFTVLRPPLFLLVVGSSCPRRLLRVSCGAILRVSAPRLLAIPDAPLSRGKLCDLTVLRNRAFRHRLLSLPFLLLYFTKYAWKLVPLSARTCKKIEYKQIFSMTQKKFSS